MTDRRTLLLDTALELVGTRGLRALTHRAVDVAAGLPIGSTVNVFRSRSDLVAAALDRLLEREVTVWEQASGPGGSPPPARAAAVVATATELAGVVGALLGPARRLTLARLALFHEAAFDPELRRRVVAARGRLLVPARAWFAARGLDVDDEGVSVLLATVNGILANQAAGPEPGYDPERSLRLVLDAVAKEDR